MPKTVIADTTCFIVLSDIDELDLLQKVYTEIITTHTIAEEFGAVLPSWIQVTSPKDRVREVELSQQVDKGEASAIALALEMPDSLLILDDMKARRLARTLHLQLTGTLGVLIKAKQIGIIDVIKPTLIKIQASRFHISDELIEEVLRISQE